MPYVEKMIRPDLDVVVQALEDAEITANGDLNYILFKFCRTSVPPSYTGYKNFIAELTECGEEIRRRLLSVYEDGKRRINGDVL